MRVTLAILLLALTTNAFAQCRNGRCYAPAYYPVQVIQPAPPPPAKPIENPRIAFEKRTAGQESGEEFFGVDNSKLSGNESYTIHTENGCKHVSKGEAHKAVGAPTLQDDSNKLRITVIGDDGQQKQVIADIQSLLKDINNWAILRGYPPNHWSLDPGFVTTGSPTIYCQAPNGKVLHRQDDYNGGAEPTVDALRKAKKNYDASKDPDLRKTQLNQPSNGQLLTYGLAATAGAGITYLSKRRKP